MPEQSGPSERAKCGDKIDMGAAPVGFNAETGETRRALPILAALGRTLML
jgi:hypothetical protein